MASNSLRKASLQSMEAEIESLLKTLEHLKHDASEESQKTMKALRGSAESADDRPNKVMSSHIQTIDLGELLLDPISRAPK